MPENVETVFVLGAGASYDFGFPTGEELIGDILEFCEELQSYFHKKTILVNLSSHPRFEDLDIQRHHHIMNQQLLGNPIRVIAEFFLDSEFSNLYNQFSRRLATALPLSKSIENYLNDQSDSKFRDFGKTIIAAILLLAEHSRSLKEFENWRELSVKLVNFDHFMQRIPPDFNALRVTWLPTFFHELLIDNGREVSSLEAFKARLKKIAIVTFNFERSFEYFMHEAFKAYQPDLTDDDRNELMDILLGQIVHPYGSLGNLDELPFASELNDVQDWNAFTDRLAIFTESEALNTELNRQRDKTRAWVANAKNIVFLGFGFHEQNMEYLGFEKNHNVANRKCYTTALGWSEHRQKGLHGRLTRQNQNLTLGNGQANQDCFLVPDTCKTLLEEYAVQIFPKS